ncbi:MAG: hypothetical protein ACRC33_13115 [Gemmataceae bacterium]
MTKRCVIAFLAAVLTLISGCCHHRCLQHRRPLLRHRPSACCCEPAACCGYAPPVTAGPPLPHHP